MKGFFTSLMVILFTSVNSKFYTCDNCLTTNCVTFSVSQGTGCEWMCNYCANKLETDNYYFLDNVCTYQQGIGCVGNPYAGASYTCCAVS